VDIKRNGSRPSGKGPAEYFTGAVRVDPLFEAPEPARVRGAHVTFEPGARTAWHTHPLGQTRSSRLASAGFSARAPPLKRSSRATSSGLRRARSIGTARPPQLP
jgi:hypothetical protein